MSHYESALRSLEDLKLLAGPRAARPVGQLYYYLQKVFEEETPLGLGGALENLALAHIQSFISQISLNARSKLNFHLANIRPREKAEVLDFCLETLSLQAQVLRNASAVEINVLSRSIEFEFSNSPFRDQSQFGAFFKEGLDKGAWIECSQKFSGVKLSFHPLSRVEFSVYPAFTLMGASQENLVAFRALFRDACNPDYQLDLYLLDQHSYEHFDSASAPLDFRENLEKLSSRTEEWTLKVLYLDIFSFSFLFRKLYLIIFSERRPWREVVNSPASKEKINHLPPILDIRQLV